MSIGMIYPAQNGWVVDRYQPGDGTAYTVHFMSHMHGGIIACVNDDSMWLAFKDGEVRHLCGNNNEYTKRAVSTLVMELV